MRHSKRIITVLFTITTVISCIATAFATGFGGGSHGGSFSGGGFSTGTTSTMVSYDALSALCLDLNDRLAAGDFGDDLKKVSCTLATYTDGNEIRYGIVYNYRAVNYWYCNASGGRVYALPGASGTNTDLDGISTYLHTMLDRIVYEFTDVESLVSYTTTAIETYGEHILSYLRTIQASTTKIEVDVGTMDTTLSGMSADVATMLNRVQSIYDHTLSLDLNVEAILSNLSSIPAMAKDISDAAAAVCETEIDVNIMRYDVAAILAKLNNLTIPASYDDTELLKKLDTLNMSAGMQWVNNYLSSINQSTNKMLDMFSLGETKTIELKENQFGAFNYSDLGAIQSVRVSGNNDSGFVLFAVGGITTDYLTTISECNSGAIPYPDYFWTVDVPTDILTITVPSNAVGLGTMGSRVPAGTYTVSLYDPSGALISLAAGDKLRPSSTVGRWEVLRAAGDVVSIAGCTGFPDGCDFADISPRCARVLVRDLVAAPSLLTSYAAETALVNGAHSKGAAYFQLINTSGQSLTVEYITPSPLLNWYANRQDDFRYWLDTRLSSLPVSKSADLTGVISRLDTLIENSASKVENVTNVVIEETNNAYNVFYVTTDDGDKKSIGEVSGDALSASGKLLNFLYKLCFENALSKVDDSITNMDGFYFDNAAGLEGSVWD